MPKISEPALREVNQALERFAAEVRQSRLKPSSQDTRISQASMFVRWLADNYAPRSRAGRQSLNSEMD